ncbi:MAG: hypothetical protein K1000chlam4_00911 [Chlamydiae bacterium]|nr:hypothetical protein [Chlamydiota bacterium]
MLEGGATIHDHANGLAQLIFEKYDLKGAPCYQVEVGKTTCSLPGSRDITVETVIFGHTTTLTVTANTADGPKTFHFPLLASLLQNKT